MRASMSFMRRRRRIRLGKAVTRVVMRHEGDARLRALALGDIGAAISTAGLSWVIARREKIATSISAPSAWRCFQVRAGSRSSSGRRSKTIRHRSSPGTCRKIRISSIRRGRNHSARRPQRSPRGSLVLNRANEHRHRIAVEQQPNDSSRRFISVMSTRSPITPPSLFRRSSIIIPRPSAEPLLVPPPEDKASRGARPSIPLRGRSLRENRPAQYRCATCPAAARRPKQIGTALIDIGVFLVPQNVTAFGIEKDQTMRQNIDRVPEPLVWAWRACSMAASASARFRTISPISAETRRLLLESFGLGLAGRPVPRAIAACFGIFLVVLGRIFGIACAPIAFCVGVFR